MIIIFLGDDREGHRLTVALHKNDVWIVYYFTKNMKEYAIRCIFDNPLCCTGQANRQNEISRIVNNT